MRSRLGAFLFVTILASALIGGLIGDRVNAATKSEIDNVINDLKRAMEGEDAAEIRRQTDMLTHASHGLSETLYQQASQAGSCQDGECAGDAAGGQTHHGSHEDVVDAEYQEVA